MSFHAAIWRWLVLASLAFVPAVAQAQVTSTNLSVQITITGGCTLQNVSNINFGSHALLTANVDVSGSFEVVCTTGVPYSLSLNGGGAANVAARRMILSAQTISYQLYRDGARSLVWGETLAVDRVTGTGNGTAQSQTVYARVPPQTTPAAGTYTDTVVITVDF